MRTPSQKTVTKKLTRDHKKAKQLAKEWRKQMGDFKYGDKWIMLLKCSTELEKVFGL